MMQLSEQQVALHLVHLLREVTCFKKKKSY